MFFLYTATIFLSAFLVFLVQPMIGKIFLPWVGGAPAAWNTCMFFFQMLLLGGYYYTHISLKKLTVRRQMLVHFIIMGVALATLPIAFKGGAVGVESPAFWLLKQLFFMVALPFFILSSTAPLLQKWFFYTKHSRASNPFFLYAASNGGSLLALLAYPLLIEPRLNVLTQTKVWSWGFGVLLVLMLGCAWFVKPPKTKEVQEEAEPIAREKIIRWVLAAFVPTSLFLSVTQHITTDIAPVPMIWIIPLMVYLLTFILAFSESVKINMKTLQVVALGSIIYFFPVYFIGFMTNKKIIIVFHLFFLLALSLLCHKDLSNTKPKAENLTVFYLWVSLGGALGGFFNSLVAPYLFSGYVEYPLVVLLATIFITSTRLKQKEDRLEITANSLIYAIIFVATIWFVTTIPFYKWALHNVTYFSLGSEFEFIMSKLNALMEYGDSFKIMFYAIVATYSIFLFHKSPKFSLLLFTAFVMGLLFFMEVGSKRPVIFRSRNFFGTKEVVFEKNKDLRQLKHGNTYHGRQSMVPELRHLPLTYYHRNGPVGQLFDARGQDPDLKVAVVGLGVGTTAAYCKEGQEMYFYEIDPQVVDIANNDAVFTYLKDSVGSNTVIIGDGRLKLEEAEDEFFDMIFLDAFSSDYVPMHLMTVEAVETYLKKLKKGGLIAFHISNRFITLTPLMCALAKELNLHCLMAYDNNFNGKLEDNWNRMITMYAVMSKEELNLPKPPEISNFEWLPCYSENEIKVWTDDFSSLAPLLMLGK